MKWLPPERRVIYLIHQLDTWTVGVVIAFALFILIILARCSDSAELKHNFTVPPIPEPMWTLTKTS